MSENDSIQIDGQSFNLADLANFGWEDVEAVKTTRLNAGSYIFSIEEASVKLQEINDKETNSKIKVMTIPIKLKVDRCFGALPELGSNEEAPDPDSLVGKNHQETFFIKSTEAYGRFKQFLIDIGFVPQNPKATFQDIIASLPGTQFAGQIKHTRDKADTDKIYVNLRLDKVKSITAVAE